MGITELTIAVWPWLLTMLVFLVVVTYWPALSLWLPQTLGMIVATPASREAGAPAASAAAPGRIARPRRPCRIRAAAASRRRAAAPAGDRGPTML